MEISSLNDIQKLKVKDLREILKSNSKSTGGIRADFHDIKSKSDITETDRSPGSTTEAVQYGLESEAKAVAL